jgi:hypothetical protein
MTRYLNRWTAQAAWVALMGIVGLIFVPASMSVVNLVMFTVAGSVVMITAAVLWGAHQPEVSASQARVAVDAAEAATSARRRG